jgi:hypothetical protein
MRLFLFTVIGFLLTVTPVLAANTGFIPISPIPDANGGQITDSSTLADYVNAAFKLALAAGAVVAVINISIGGFEYILSEAVSSKGDGKKRIQQSLYGLAILLLVYLILFVINPDLVSLRLFS